MQKKINWIVSYPKSGNTWVRAIIASFLFTTNGIFNFGLMKLIEQFEKKKWFDFLNTIDPKSANNLTDIKFVSKYWIEAQERIIIQDNYNFLYNFFKTHSINVNLDGHEFTNKKVTNGLIYIVRDPRDVAVSFSKHRGEDIDSIIELMIDQSSMFPEDNERIPIYLSRWDDHYNSWHKAKLPKIIIKYEELINDTKKTLQKIKKFLKHKLQIKIDDNEIIIQNISDTTHFTKMKEFEKNHGFNEASENSVFFRKGKSMQWKNILSTKQINKIEREFKVTMKKLDYL